MVALFVFINKPANKFKSYLPTISVNINVHIIIEYAFIYLLVIFFGKNRIR